MFRIFTIFNFDFELSRLNLFTVAITQSIQQNETSFRIFDIMLCAPVGIDGKIIRKCFCNFLLLNIISGVVDSYSTIIFSKCVDLFSFLFCILEIYDCMIQQAFQEAVSSKIFHGESFSKVIQANKRLEN